MRPNLPGDLLAAIGHLRHRPSHLELRLRAAPRRPCGDYPEPTRFLDRALNSPVSAVSLSTSPLACPERRRIVRLIASSLRPIDRERSRTRRLFSPISLASLRPSRGSVLTPAEANPASVGYRNS
jgi:hypothetical protein